MDVHPYNGRIGIDQSPLQSDLRRGSRRHHCQDWPLRMCGKDPHCDKAVCLHKQPPGSKSGQPVWPTLHQKWVHWHSIFKPMAAIAALESPHLRPRLFPMLPLDVTLLGWIQLRTRDVLFWNQGSSQKSRNMKQPKKIHHRFDVDHEQNEDGMPLGCGSKMPASHFWGPFEPRSWAIPIIIIKFNGSCWLYHIIIYMMLVNKKNRCNTPKWQNSKGSTKQMAKDVFVLFLGVSTKYVAVHELRGSSLWSSWSPFWQAWVQFSHQETGYPPANLIPSIPSGNST